MCNTYHLHSRQLVDLLSHLTSAFPRAASVLSGFLQTEKRCGTSSFLNPELTRISIKTARSKWDCLCEVFPQNWNVKNPGFTFSAIFLKGLSHGIICVSQTFSNIWSLKPSPNSLRSLEILPISECLHRVLKHARNRPTSPSCFHGSRGRGCWYTSIFVQPETVTALHWDTCFTAEPKSKLNEKVYRPSGKSSLSSNSVDTYWLVQKKGWFVSREELSKMYSHNELIILFCPYRQPTVSSDEKKKQFLFNIWGVYLFNYLVCLYWLVVICIDGS